MGELVTRVYLYPTTCVVLSLTITTPVKKKEQQQQH